MKSPDKPGVKRTNTPLSSRNNMQARIDHLVISADSLSQGVDWVINTHDIDGLIRQAIFSLGESILINRGILSWNFGLPKDGRLLTGGLLPYAIEWHSDKHPSENMTDLGCSLAFQQDYRAVTG